MVFQPGIIINILIIKERVLLGEGLIVLRNGLMLRRALFKGLS